MCGYCGCQGVDAIGELRDEHAVLLDEAHDVRRAVSAGDRPAAVSSLASLVDHLTRHVAREERGVFTALREQGDFAEEVLVLEGEHTLLDVAVAALDPESDDFADQVLGLLEDLEQHIEREDNGVFPVSVVTLSAGGWATVERAHREVPTFLAELTLAGAPRPLPSSTGGGRERAALGASLS